MSPGSISRQVRTAGFACAAAALLSGCISASAGPQGLYATPIGNAPVTANPTPYSAALYCMADYARRYSLPSPRISVGRIADYTGTVSADGGRQVTGGASLMAMTALAKSGAHIVERYDTSVSEMELRYANNRLIGDGGPGGADDVQYRRILAGSVPGSDFYIIGGITEVNYNIRSGGFDMAAGQASSQTPLSTAFAGKAYVMNIAIDLRLVQTTSLEVVDVVSYQKQIIGREISAGVFDFLNGNVFDISAGEGGLEPVQLAVRALIERATVEFMANLYGAPGPEICLSAGPDPLGGPVGPTGGFYPAYPNTDTNNGATRADPSRWHDRRDGAVRRSRY
ncbi:MAG: holdfast anchoring protein HfaB [Brevundimonas sp.]|uniref:holdfast anchoring protein HfaB n=1 Tax=Brevundimonas sp. TaxID=1871086 RepID=UPI00271E8AA4|nr:holdfast anchoring protein HfaB [Brevundimonas sp.]MDO9588584.1 holdfast anchoring protein HfaB [Brevundimonas sp.]MDP3371228.1 holdfast anchoring protein HfaB [Brevundimonas sp.]MDP3656386.1 holdfast anchoring protein HfaB [Brevundimonas sp.]MDZ4111056.1 holdfast anchoring protein HfaB [Brevundimonas sp.]